MSNPDPADIPENKDLPQPNRRDPEVQAVVAKRRAPKEPPAENEWCAFVSVDDEPAAFDIAGYPSMRWGKRLAWRIPLAHRDGIRRHHFFQVGRIREATKEEIGAA